jgi:hypothetical protein
MESKPGNLESLANTTGKTIKKEAAETTTSTSKPDPAPVDSVPDPDEDDLDDLDGLKITESR